MSTTEGVSHITHLLGRVEGKLDGYLTRVERVEGRVDSLDSRVGGLENLRWIGAGILLCIPVISALAFPYIQTILEIVQ